MMVTVFFSSAIEITSSVHTCAPISDGAGLVVSVLLSCVPEPHSQRPPAPVGFLSVDVVYIFSHLPLPRSVAMRYGRLPPWFLSPAFPYLCLVRSTKRYCEPGDGVGGSGSPRVTVRSGPLPPFGPTIWYCPDAGAFWPGRYLLLAIAYLHQFR